MARYDGGPGRTRKERIHYTCPCGTRVVADIHRAVDVSSDADAGQRLLAGTLNQVRCPGDEQPRPVEVPVVYHAPASELLVLVLPDGMRHRELAERAALMTAMAEDTSAPVPAYAADFHVVYGADGLRALLEGKAEKALDDRRRAEETRQLERLRTEIEHKEKTLADQQHEIDRLATQLDQSQRDLDALSTSLEQREAALDRRTAELDRRTAELKAKAAELKTRQAPLPAAAPEPVVAAETTPMASGNGVPATEPFDLIDDRELIVESGPTLDVEVQEETTGSLDTELEVIHVGEGEALVADQIVSDGQGAEPAPIGENGETRIGGQADVAIERWIVSRDKSLKVVGDDGQVRLAVSADPDELEALIAERLGMKLQLHRLPTYALVTLTFATPEVIRGEAEGRSLVFFFDVREREDRAVLETLGREFTFRLELFDSEYLPVRRRTVTSSLAENVGYVLSAAEAHLAQVPARERSFDRAILAYDDPNYDRLGVRHAEHREFREDKLTKLGNPSEVRRAVAIARRFSLPEREAYLICVRGYSLSDWRAKRRMALEAAISVGLWLGNTLAQVAVSEGLARSRKDLVARLESSFGRTSTSEGCDLDQEAIDDNWDALEGEAEKLGLPRRGPGKATSEDGPMASGTIGSTAVRPPRAGSVGPAMAGAAPVAHRTVEQLVAQLEDPDRRLDAAVELAKRGEDRALGPVFNSMRRMNRNEAVRVLGVAVGFGPAAVPHLSDGLRSRKGFLRHGCAMALAALGSEDGIEAVCDALVSEPTEIWREIARSLGQVGAAAIMPLGARLGGQGDRARERVAWALAHIAAGGDETPVRQMAASRDATVSTVARRALELAGPARAETSDLMVSEDVEEHTVNRAFSRTFYEALQRVRPEAVPVAAPVSGKGSDLSAPAMLLDEADLIEAPDLNDALEEAELLDESDLIPT